MVRDDADTKLHIFRWLHDSAIGGHSGKGFYIAKDQIFILLAKDEFGDAELCSELFHLPVKQV